MLDSVAAAVGSRHRERDRFPLRARQFRAAEHGLTVQLQLRRHDLGVHTVHLVDVRYFSARSSHLVVRVAQLLRRWTSRELS